MKFSLILAVLLGGPALAQDPAGEIASDESSALGPWANGRTRAFVALEPQIGLGTLQATVRAGYGKPYFIWGGAEAFVFASPNSVELYGGVRATFILGDLRLGVRRSIGLANGFAPQAASHSYDDFHDASSSASYTALNAELSGVIPAPGGFAFWDFEWLGLRDTPGGVDLYENFFKVAARPPNLGAARLAYVYTRGKLGIGPFGDLTATFGRGTLLRIGPYASWQFTDHVDLIGVAGFTARSPDSLGVLYGTFGSIFIRWRWASGETHPHFP